MVFHRKPEKPGSAVALAAAGALVLFGAARQQVQQANERLSQGLWAP